MGIIMGYYCNWIITIIYIIGILYIGEMMGLFIVLYDYNGSNEMQWDRFGIDNMDIGFVQGVFWFPNDIQWETHFFGNQDGIC